jgi:hypothetical protein
MGFRHDGIRILSSFAGLLPFDHAPQSLLGMIERCDPTPRVRSTSVQGRSGAMTARAGILVLVHVVVVTVGCSFARDQAKSAADTGCSKSCKNQPADTQGECIARCTK